MVDPWQLVRLFLIGAGVVYLLVLVAAFVFQRKLIFPAPLPARQPGSSGKLLQIPAHPEVVAYALSPTDKQVPIGAEQPLLVWFHGNAEQIADLVPLAGEFSRRGLGVVLVEYPGYGLASGAPSEESIYRAAEVVLTYLHKDLGVQKQRITLFGQSLGSGVAVEMAKRGHGGKLVLLSPYTSIPNMAARAMPYLPAAYLVKDQLDSLSKAAEVRVPVLVLHGQQDEVIPVSMGQELASRFASSTLRILPRGHHNDLWDQIVEGKDLLGVVAAFVD